MLIDLSIEKIETLKHLKLHSGLMCNVKEEEDFDKRIKHLQDHSSLFKFCLN